MVQESQGDLFRSQHKDIKPGNWFQGNPATKQVGCNHHQQTNNEGTKYLGDTVWKAGVMGL